MFTWHGERFDTRTARGARIEAASAVLVAQATTLVREAGLSTPTAEALVRRALAGYAAAAILMPYERFARAVEDKRYVFR